MWAKKATSCTYTGTCTAFFSVEPDGRIMPCDRLSNRSELVFGNLNEESLLDILNGNARLHFAETVNRVHPDCVKCELYNVCHNGCTMHRVGGLDGKYYYCEARKTLFAHMQEKIEALQAKSVLP
ncbi:MAG: SPASM domain-containing protein [Chloroflexi bacterium]|nr:SPASM domain-containing protein [Chloroflexota bacterium]